MNTLVPKLILFFTLMGSISFASEDGQGGPECVYAEAFWRSHLEEWPYDPATTKLGDQLWTTILASPTNGHPWFVLARQYIVTELNVSLLSDNYSAEFFDFLDFCHSFLETYDESVSQQYFILAALLADFNGGLLADGPQLCEENQLTLEFVTAIFELCPIADCPLYVECPDCPDCPKMECPKCPILQCPSCPTVKEEKPKFTLKSKHSRLKRKR